MITKEQLAQIMPYAAKARRLERYYEPLTTAMQKYGISSSLPQTEMFLANVAQETGELRWLTELGSGREYEGREDLGNIHPGDGVRYKGRGAFQLTGRANYIRVGNILGIDLVDKPELAADPRWAFEIAGLYWQQRCATLADQGRFADVVKAINGGLNGLSSRMKYYARAIKVLNASSTQNKSGNVSSVE